MKTQALTAPDYRASGAQRGLNTHSHNPDSDLLKRFAVIRDGHPEVKPSGGLYMATEDTAEQARERAAALIVDFPGHTWHIFDTRSEDWEPVG